MAEIIVTTSSPAVIAVTTSQFLDTSATCESASVTLGEDGDEVINVASGGVGVIILEDSSGDGQTQRCTTNGSGTIIIPSVNWKNEMEAAADAYFLRAGTSNAAFENAVIDWAKRIGDHPFLYRMLSESAMIYLGFPESEETASYPFFLYEDGMNVSTDRIRNLNSAVWSSALGWTGNGIDSTFFIPVFPAFWPAGGPIGRENLTWYQYFTDVPAGGLTRTGFSLNAASRLSLSGTSVSLSVASSRIVLNVNLDFSTLRKGLLMVQDGYDLISIRDSLYNLELFSEADNYATPLGSADFFLSSVLTANNRVYAINAMSTGTTTDPLNPITTGQYSGHSIASLIFANVGFKDEAKLLAAATDQLQNDFGR